MIKIDKTKIAGFVIELHLIVFSMQSEIIFPGIKIANNESRLEIKDITNLIFKFCKNILQNVIKESILEIIKIGFTILWQCIKEPSVFCGQG